MGRELPGCGPPCGACRLVCAGLCLGADVRVKVAVGIVVLWWLLQVALFVVR